MLSVMRKSWLLFTILALVALSSALELEDLHLDGIGHFLHKGKRQAASGTGNNSPPPASSTPAPKSSAPPASSAAPTSQPPQTSAAPQSSDDASSQAASSQPPATSAAATTKAPASTAAPTSAAASSKTPDVVTSALVATSVQQFTTVFTTVSDGSSFAITQTGSRTALITTGQATFTDPATVQHGGDNNSKGLSPTNQKIVGGVVGGVGGALFLGGLALVAWRIWGKKKRVSEDDDDLMAGTGSALGDKPHNNSSTPFQSNLEQYHNPGGRPNAAANF